MPPIVGMSMAELSSVNCGGPVRSIPSSSRSRPGDLGEGLHVPDLERRHVGCRPVSDDPRSVGADRRRGVGFRERPLLARPEVDDGRCGGCRRRRGPRRGRPIRRHRCRGSRSRPSVCRSDRSRVPPGRLDVAHDERAVDLGEDVRAEHGPRRLARTAVDLPGERRVPSGIRPHRDRTVRAQRGEHVAGGVRGQVDDRSTALDATGDRLFDGDVTELPSPPSVWPTASAVGEIPVNAAALASTDRPAGPPRTWPVARSQTINEPSAAPAT